MNNNKELEKVIIKAELETGEIIVSPIMFGFEKNNWNENEYKKCLIKKAEVGFYDWITIPYFAKELRKLPRKFLKYLYNTANKEVLEEYLDYNRAWRLIFKKAIKYFTVKKNGDKYEFYDKGALITTISINEVE